MSQDVIDSTPKDGVKRREFLKVLGATGAAATPVGCASDKVEKLIPYVASPDNTVPGVSSYYATTCRECAAGCGLVVETRDGRAIKAEGNPEHPVNHGALCARGQAGLQGLYNPDRFRGPMIREGGKLVATSWDKAIAALQAKLNEVKGQGKAGTAVFINQHEQGSFPAFLDQWLAAHGMPAHLSYDAEAPLATVAANRASFNVSWPKLDFAAAKLIVSFGADYLDGWGLSVPQQLAFAEARAKLDDAPRAVYIGARRSLTGLNSDTWIPARPGSEKAIAEALLAAVKGSGSLKAAADAAGVSVASLEALAKELQSAKPSLLIAGGNDDDATGTALAVNELNKALGNVGVTVKPAEGSLAYEGAGSHAAVREAGERMAAGAVALAFVRGANPAHTLPGAAKFAAAFAKAGYKVSFSSYPDETTDLCDLVLPDHHALESWGDAEPVKGTLSLQQPTMDPVYDTRATADVLIALAKSDAALSAKMPADYRAFIAARVGGNANLAAALPKGIANGSALPAPAPKPVASKPGAGIGQSQGPFHLHVYRSPVLGDGRGANKPWLQELPDPVTKTLWQTVVELHPETARKLGLEEGDHATVETAQGSLTAPVYLYIGIRPDTVGIATGRGHTSYGRYANGCGVNPMTLLPVAEDAKSGAVTLVSTRAGVKKADGSSRLVTTEGSGRQHGRGIARAVSVADFIKGDLHDEKEEFVGQASTAFLPGLRSPVANDAQGELGDPKSKDKGQYDPNHWSGVAKRRWAMTIDLAKCTGCAACVTACYAENNIPTVGAPWQGSQVMPDRTGFGANITRSREMAWIRLERYFEIDREPKDVEFDPDFETRVIPMMCQHCGNAPCEPVCPVYATYHSPDGLNVQVYNRCVGTRYCSNNCPYKVRYFNWFGYGEADRVQYAFPEPLHWQLNPDVTVRGKGVMEKCSFCVQRIREAENRAKLEQRELKPDEFTTACAQACPSRAIIFGDAADEQWSVAQQLKDERGYHVFEELNTFTAVVYLQKVNHPSPAAATKA
ncbi:MAG: 4Fe-4S dicluster domain-containing protein [Gemmatimonadetes bacterium]|nr:4Fe-4S dicluster domain-containing protein [Gemmatimonadota bacterium]